MWVERCGMPLFMALEVRPHADINPNVEAKLLSGLVQQTHSNRQNDDDEDHPPVCGAASASD
jgi:hypothetical protein